MQNKYEPSPQLLITNNTEKLLLLRAKDDHRVHFAHYILYGDGIREDINNSNNKPPGFTLRKAQPGDMFTYSLIADYKMIKLNLEQNLTNLATLKARNQLPDLRRIWAFCYDITEEEANKADGTPSVVIYADPNAADVNNIIKDDRILLGVFIVIEFDSPETLKNPELGSARAEWALISPADSNNIKEYNEYLKEKEAETLGRLFYLKFDSKLLDGKENK
jgi:hypothetical protein